MKAKLFILAVVILTLLTSCGSKTTTGKVIEKEKIVRASGEHDNVFTLMANYVEQSILEVTSAAFVIVLCQRYECEGAPSYTINFSEIEIDDVISSGVPGYTIFGEDKLQEGGKVDQ